MPAAPNLKPTDQLAVAEQNNSTNLTKSTEQVDTSYLNKVNQELYKRNLELAVRNKTLSLLRNLYEITTHIFSPEELTRKLTFEIRTSLNLELVSIFVVDNHDQCVKPIALSSSQATKAAFSEVEDKFSKLCIPVEHNDTVLAQVVNTKQRQEVTIFSKLFNPFLPEKKLSAIQRQVEIQTSLVFPLLISQQVIGLLVIAMDKSFDDLSLHEQEAIESLIDVVAVALDKANNYLELKLANTYLRELDEVKSEFMSVASHQLRTPLTGIIGYLSMILEGEYGKMEAEQAQVMNDVYLASQRLARMINVLLNVTRIEAGHFIMNFGEYNLIEIINTALNELKPVADKKNLALVFVQANSKPVKVMVDNDRVRDVFLNLIDNAIKYTAQGTITIQLLPEDNNKIHFFVTDTGMGIDTKEAHHLFEKFIRGSGIARIQPDGSGLGLYIAKKIVDGHSGQIWVESPGEDKGTTFHVELPVKQDKPQYHAEAERIFEGKSIQEGYAIQHSSK
ncbi:MAG: HAMP domain-containing histidine kinase [Candidatus Kerfeldbacteria bacterium]|nr:HAMP domain-containing histidine kinase [Candidatus Kerfeldbacteria bacterium]